MSDNSDNIEDDESDDQFQCIDCWLMILFFNPAL